MRQKKTAYELSSSQVETPLPVVKLYWEIVSNYRSNISTVLDLGAGDGRFMYFGKYKKYDGVEIDRNRINGIDIPHKAAIHNECAFEYNKQGYSICIGNPPYVRHHDLDENWRDKIVNKLNNEIGISINRKCNLYSYFLMLGILKTNKTGLIAMVVPYEWVSRPSTKYLRDYINEKKWHVDIYRFTEEIFSNVLTTSSISIIDKKNNDGKWDYYSIDAKGVQKKHQKVTISSKEILPYEKHGVISAKRGLSPGTQKIFTISEGERIHLGLTRNDVTPCVTSLRYFSDGITHLNYKNFREYYIDAGLKCWLINSYTKPSQQLSKYLKSIPKRQRDTWTCNNQRPWYKYKLNACPQILMAAGFTRFGPKIVHNDIKAHPVGSVCGIYSNKDLKWDHLRNFLRGICFEKRVVAHSGSLKKIEIKQLNYILNRYSKRYHVGR